MSHSLLLFAKHISVCLGASIAIYIGTSLTIGIFAMDPDFLGPLMGPLTFVLAVSAIVGPTIWTTSYLLFWGTRMEPDANLRPLFGNIVINLKPRYVLLTIFISSVTIFLPVAYLLTR